MFCTDVAARGLDFPSIDWVVQFDCPDNAESYIHRDDLPSSNNQEMNSIPSINQDVYVVSSSIVQETNEQQPLINQNKMNEQQQILSENKLINKSYKPSYDEDSSVYTSISDFNINNDYPLLHQSVTNDFDYNNYHDPMFQEDYFSDELYPYDFDLNDLSYPCEYLAYQHNQSDNVIF